MVTRKNRLKYGSFTAAQNERVSEFGQTFVDNIKSINTNWIVPDIAPLNPGERGIIISAPVIYEGDSMSTESFNFADLRHAVLFFDKVLYASNNIIHVAPPSEIDWLYTRGVAETVMCRGAGHFDVRCIIEAQKALFRKLDAELPGVWGIGRGDTHAMFSADELEAKRGICMKLFSAIPVPDEDVHLEDILEFKMRRRSELLSLRFHIEELYQDILSKPDQALAERTALDGIKLSIVDHIRTMRESGMKFRMSDISMKFTAADALIGVIAWAAADQIANLNLFESIGVGLGAALHKSLLSLSIDVNIAGKKAGSSPFEYVSRYHTEVFN